MGEEGGVGEGASVADGWIVGEAIGETVAAGSLSGLDLEMVEPWQAAKRRMKIKLNGFTFNKGLVLMQTPGLHALSEFDG